MRNRPQNHLANAGRRECEKDNAREKDRTQSSLPGDMHFEADRIGEVRVETHARRECNGIARDDAHENGAERRRETRGRSDRRQRNACCGEDGGVDEHDVSHREEGRDSGQNLGAPVGPR